MLSHAKNKIVQVLILRGNMGISFYDLFGKNLKNFYESSKDVVLNKMSVLDKEQEVKIYEILKNLDRYLNYVQRLKLDFGRILDYNALKQEGYTINEIENFYQEDKDYITDVDSFYVNNLKKRDYMFGYPANMETYSYSVQYLRSIESQMYLMNNCGDPYQLGNYGMDSKCIEKRIIKLIAQNLGLSVKDKYWGYITSGGTESNFWGIREGFNVFPDGKLFFSEDTHYSVEKFVTNNDNKIYNYQKVQSNSDGTINVKALKQQILKDMQAGMKAVILVLTWGTTCKGAVDEVKQITSFLQDKNIPYYCHLDAALFGGIPNNQVNAPLIANIKDLNVDSIAISLHKYLGSARVNGILIAMERQKRKMVDYIGQEDSTLLGSRDFLPFSTYQRVKEILLRSPKNRYNENVEYFENGLNKYNINYEKDPNSNIFIIKKPSNAICKKYQLATFSDSNKNQHAHILIFPFHKKEIIKELLIDLKGENL